MGERVRQSRKHHGWTQAQLAEFCEMGRTGLSKIERGLQNPTLAQAECLSRELGLSLDLLVGRQAEAAALGEWLRIGGELPPALLQELGQHAQRLSQLWRDGRAGGVSDSGPVRPPE